MKKALKYIGAFLTVAILGAFTACTMDIDPESVETGLKIKAFAPTKVVAGQPMTITGHGFADVKEIVFPNDIVVTSFERVGNEMIRVAAPRGISAEGGKLKVRTAEEEAESSADLTLGNTVVTGYSKQAGESIKGGELLTIYGKDLEFINSVEMLDGDALPVIVEDNLFYRKGTNNAIIIIPKNVFEGTFVGKLHTIDGKVFDLPELAYEPASEEEGHWEIVKTAFWTNEDPEGNGKVSWNGLYRFCLEGHDENDECLAEFSQDVWDVVKSGTFYLRFQPVADWYQVRITNGWWDVQWQGKDNDFSPNNMADRIIDNGDGTFTIEIKFDDDPLVETLDQKHLLVTGDGFIPLELYFTEEEWVEGGGHLEIVKNSLWKNDDPEGNGKVSWNGLYRFCLEGHDENDECLAEFPQETWDIITSGTFYLQFQPVADWYQVRITNGWWDVQWQGKDNDFSPNNMADRIIDNEDGTFYIEINFGDDPLVATLEQKHLLITGDGFIPLELYTQEEVWVGGGGDGPKEIDIWKNDDPEGHGKVSWNGLYRFCLEGHDDNDECLAEFPEDLWNIIKTGTFYLQFQPVADWYQVRITNGWWDPQWQGKDNDFSPNNMADRIIDNEDGTFHIEINFGDDPVVETLDQKHLLVTGDGFIPLRLYYME